MSKIAVCIPSRLQVNMASPVGNLYVQRAIGSVRRQTVAKDHDIRIIVGVDAKDGEAAGRLMSTLGISCVSQPAYGTPPGQAAAANAAARSACDEADIIAFLEDDDLWHERKLEFQLAALDQGFEFVSCSQREIDEEGSYVRVNDFATPSGWLMPVQTWKDVGPFDESFKWHLDNAFLGVLNEKNKKRLHFAEMDAEKAIRNGDEFTLRPWLMTVSQFSRVAMTTGVREPLVTRTINPRGGMTRIATDPVAAAESQNEHQRLWEKFGARLPW